MAGYVHVYTGEGKGKTAAALGFAIRAIGAGLKVYLAQFPSGDGEIPLRALEKVSDQLLFRKYGDIDLSLCETKGKERQRGLEALSEIHRAMISGKYQLIILDGANTLVCYGILKVEDLLQLIDMKPRHVDLIITGDCAAPQIIKRADLVTEMKAIKTRPSLTRWTAKLQSIRRSP